MRRLPRPRLALLAVLASACAAPAAATAPAPVCPAAPPPAPPPKVAPAPARPEAKFEKLPPEASLVRVVTAKEVQPAWFAKAFSDKIPIDEVTKLVTSMDHDLGGFRRVEAVASGYKTFYANGFVPTKIHLDEAGKIDGLFFGPPELDRPRPLDEILAELHELPGKVSVLVTTGDKVEGALDPDAALAVGSTFKLAILAALKDRVDAKKLAWTRVVELKSRHKSLPSGILQEWPDGAPLTVHSLASLMISRSDNTATDVLLDFAGRAAVEKYAPGNAPMLSTHDAFVLKGKRGAELLAKWRAEGEAGRRKLLSDIDNAPLPVDYEYDSSKVTALDVEWHFSAKHVCALLGRTKDLPMFAINPGVAQKKDWDKIAYKGGSEPGVLNLSTLVRKGEKEHCVVATWNSDHPVDDERFTTLYGQLLTAVR
jgi:beta-lactamase class A